MEAEEPEYGVSTEVPDIEELKTIPEGIMRSSQIPALDPEAQEDRDPSYKWTDGHRPVMNQSKVLRDMGDHTPNSMAIFFKKESSDMETSQEILLAEACNTPDQQEAVIQSLKDRLSRTIAAPELLACAVQEEWLDIPSKLDNRVGAELQSELMSLTLAVSKEKEEEETSPDTSIPRGSWPPCKTHPGETEQTQGSGSELLRQGKQLQLEATQENQGQEGFLQSQEAQGLEEQEGQEVEIQEEGTLAFSNMTNLLSPSSPTTPWIPDLQRPTTKDESGLTEESEPPVRGSFRRSAPQEEFNNTRRSALGSRKNSEKPLHHQLEKASSWPHRRDPARTSESSSEQVVLGQVPNKQKGWNRQGLRRPSILPESSSDLRNPAAGRLPGSSDSVVFREKKPKEGMGGFSRRCSKLISSQLLYQEYSDVVLNKEIQSQQRLDSLAEPHGLSSPRHRRKALVSSDSYLQRLSMASSGSLWQEIPVVRNSTVLLSMTHEDQKLQEAKFELIVSEASYLRSQWK